MADSDIYNPLTPPGLDPTALRELQRFLTQRAGVRISADGVLDQRTIATAFDLLRADPTGLSHEQHGWLESAAANDPRADEVGWRKGLVWIFFSNSPNSKSWIEALQPGQTIFWYHGRHTGGGAYRRQLRAGDTVLFLVKDIFVASGVLQADERLHFVDHRGRVRRPVRVLHRYGTPVGRSDVEDAIGRAPLIGQGSVHPLSPDAMAWFNQPVADSPWLPYPLEGLTEQIAAQTVARALEGVIGDDERYIRPDAPTARILGWRGKIWAPEDLPRPEPRPPGGEATEEAPEIDSQIPFVLDAPADAEDQLDRGPYALFLARRLHLIWCQINGHAPGPDRKPTKASPQDSDTFIVHVDAPWGGGKTTFANFVAKVLDPRDETLTERHFLRSTLGPTKTQEELEVLDLGDIFAPSYAKDAPEQWPGALRPWIIARYNAWRDQYVQPPWWQIFLTLHEAVSHETWRDAWTDLGASWKQPARLFPGLVGLARWAGVRFERRAYQLGNSKLRALILPWLIAVGLCLLLLLFRDSVGGAISTVSSGPTGSPTIDPRRASDWIAVLTTFLGLGGASLTALFAVLGQSLSPDLDFTAEHKHIGVHDPIRRFRRSFHKILAGTERPILLIVDDLDRCEPKTVVEILRGFQTIIRSPRLFVLLLGDRAWIETAHDVHHKDLSILRNAEGTLGSLYVQKVIQLSFRLPTMKDDARRRFARGVLGERLDETSTVDVAAALRTAEAKGDAAVAKEGSVSDREKRALGAVDAAVEALPKDLAPEQRALATSVIKDIVTAKVVAAAGSDAAHQREVFNIITQLFDCLPNNPRQIKRIFMAFATYEQVGRTLFRYQLTPVGEDGERLANRWRQLALWVTLAVEWPETWRAIARWPDILNIAFAKPDLQVALDAELTKSMAEKQRVETSDLLHRLRTEPTLRALLAGSHRDNLGAQASKFASTAIDAEAVYEFNRILWEPGFVLQVASQGSAPSAPRPTGG